MRKIAVALAAVPLALWCLGGCGVAAPRRPTIVAFDRAHRAEVWARAVALLRAQGYAFETLAENSGTLETELNDIGTRECGLSVCRARQRVTLNVEAAGSIACNIRRIFSRGDSRETFPPETQGSVDAIEHDQAELVRAILGEAALPDAGVAAPSVESTVRCYTATGASVPVPDGGCVAAGLADTAPVPTHDSVTLSCYSPMGVSVTVEGTTCAAVGLSAEPPATVATPPPRPGAHRRRRPRRHPR